MANSYICSFVNPSSITCYYGDTMQTSFPKENSLNLDFPLRPTKAYATTPATIKMRYYVPSAANTPILGILVRDVNFQYLDIKVNATSTGFGTGDKYSVTALPSYKDTRVGRYNFLWTYSTVATSLMTLASSWPYYEINQSISTPAFNSDRASLGSVYFINKFERINYDYQLPFRVTRTVPIQRTDRASGGAKIVTLGPPKVSITLPAELPSDGNSDYPIGAETMLYSWQEYDRNSGFLFWEFRDRDNNEKMSRIYHVRQSPEFQTQYNQTDSVMDSSLDFEEIV